MVFPHYHLTALHCTEVRFASFLSGGFTTMAVINPTERQNAPLCTGRNEYRKVARSKPICYLILNPFGHGT